jgi:hypothetical protein
MTEEQKSLGEKIIQLHKDNDGVFDWDNLYYQKQFPEDWGDHKKAQQSTHMQRILCEYELIEMIGKTIERSRLTKKGYGFTTFKKYDKEQKLYSSAKKSKAFQEKYWWLIMLVSFLVGFFTNEKVRQLMQNRDNPKQQQVSGKKSPVAPDTLHKK